MDTLYKNRHIYDESLVVEPDSCILDVGTGPGESVVRSYALHESDNRKGLWLLGLSKEMTSNAVLIGIDISDLTFPNIHPPNVKFQTTSVLELPEEWGESFDFIHQRFLVAALSETEWTTAIQSLFRVLKPGKYVQLVEMNCLDISSDKDTPAFSRVQEIVEKLSRSRDILLNILKRMSHLLGKAGFTEIVERKESLPAGRSAGDIGVSGKLGILDGIRQMGQGALRLGLVDSLDDWNELMDRAGEEWNIQQNISVICYMFCAKKPDI